MKYIALLILAIIMAFVYVQYDISNQDYIAAETTAPPATPLPATKAEPKQTPPKQAKVAVAAGFVSETQGDVIAANAEGGQRTLQASSQIFVGETIETRNSSAQLMLDDGAQITLKPATSFRILDFSYTANSESNISFSELLKGQLRIITGKIGKSKRDTYQLRTHIATIGVRGTDYSVRICAENECKIDFEGKTEILNSGLYMGVLEGAIVANSTAGELEIPAGKTYFQQSEKIASIEIEPIAGVLFTREEIDTFSATTGTKKDSSHWMIHQKN